MPERAASFPQVTTRRRPTIAHWPTPDEMALFDAIERIDGTQDRRLRLPAKLSSFGFDAVVALSVAIGTFGLGVGVANALTALPL